MTQRFFAGNIDAPDFPSGLDLLNCERARDLRDLRGEIVILDFWSYR